MNKKESILPFINSPDDLKSLNLSELRQLSDEVRSYIIEVLSKNPGHLGASLGVVELTVALHHVFNTPDDKLIWDVGHQSYAHKILTKRKEDFHTIRTYKGLSGFPKMSESEYDAFGTGHSSTSISAALGMAVASTLQGNKDRQHIAIIGDGALTGGMSFEALNHAGVEKSNLLVIVNDNGIAIDKNVGALSTYFTKMTTSAVYNRFKNKIWNLMGGNSNYGKTSRNFFQKLFGAVKTLLIRQSNFYESLNFRYFGPIDGHDIKALTNTLKHLKKIQGPKILHIITKKGKGMDQAENNPTLYHAPGKYDPYTFIPISSPNKTEAPRFQDVFGETILELARTNDHIVGVTPAMPTGCSLNLMMEEMPHRVFDVGIAEQHAVTFSAGLAAHGLIPYCNIYSSFMQRAYDQLIHDVALQDLPVIFCLDRAGLVGEDGATHHGVFDLTAFRSIPNVIIAAPSDEIELRNILYTAQLRPVAPYIIRYPRGKGTNVHWKQPMQELPLGKGRCIRNGINVAIVSIGTMSYSAIKAAQILFERGKLVGVYDMRFLKPLDEQLLYEICKTYTTIVTLEDGIVTGGFGSAVMEFTQENDLKTRIIPVGVPDLFVAHGTISELQEECGMDVDAIVRICEEFYE